MCISYLLVDYCSKDLSTLVAHNHYCKRLTAFLLSLKWHCPTSVALNRVWTAASTSCQTVIDGLVAVSGYGENNMLLNCLCYFCLEFSSTIYNISYSQILFIYLFCAGKFCCASMQRHCADVPGRYRKSSYVLISLCGIVLTCFFSCQFYFVLSKVQLIFVAFHDFVMPYQQSKLVELE